MHCCAMLAGRKNAKALFKGELNEVNPIFPLFCITLSDNETFSNAKNVDAFAICVGGRKASVEKENPIVPAYNGKLCVLVARKTSSKLISHPLPPAFIILESKINYPPCST